MPDSTNKIAQFLIRPDDGTFRCFPSISPTLYNPNDKDPLIAFLSADQKVARQMLGLAKRKFNVFQRYLGIGLDAQGKLGRMMMFHALALAAEQKGEAIQGNFFWKQVFLSNKSLAKQTAVWQQLAAENAKTVGTKIMSDPEQLRRRVVNEILIDTHCAFNNGWATTYVKRGNNVVPIDSPRRLFHVDYIIDYMPYSGLEGKEKQFFVLNLERTINNAFPMKQKDLTRAHFNREFISLASSQPLVGVSSSERSMQRIPVEFSVRKPKREDPVYWFFSRQDLLFKAALVVVLAVMVGLLFASSSVRDRDRTQYNATTTAYYVAFNTAKAMTTKQYHDAVATRDTAYDATVVARDKTYQQASAARTDAYKQLMAAQQNQDYLGEIKAAEIFFTNFLPDSSDDRKAEVKQIYDQAIVYWILRAGKVDDESMQHLNTYRTLIKN